MTPDAPDHFVSYETSRGSTVVLTGLTEAQRDEAAAALTPDPPAVRPVTAAGTKACGQCSGAGGWYESVTVKTGSGGTVTTQKWVNCRPCGGSGQVSK